MDRPCVRVCFTPELLKNLPKKSDEIIVVVDILRATTSMCAAFANGAKEILPVASDGDDLRHYTVNRQLSTVNYLVAGEKDGIKLPYADLGNSPLEFRREIVERKTIIFSTTNGTRAICESAAYGEVFIASFVNFSAISKYLISVKKDVLIVCAGWKGQFSLEDTLFAGKLARFLINSGFATGDDPALASVNLWDQAAGRLMELAAQGLHYKRLLGIESEGGLRYCFESPEEFEVLPKLIDGKLININSEF
jgi:2-phosphosulfolactate phosphatase